MLGVLLGAGFSKWAANLPVAAELFDFSGANGTSRNSAESLLEADVQKWKASNPEGLPEQFILWAIRNSSRTRSRAIGFLTRRLSLPFAARILGGNATFMIDDRRAQQHAGVLRAKGALLPLLGGSSGILTTNYDLLVEYALTTSGFNYGSRGEVLTGRNKNPFFPWQGGPVSLNGVTPFAKLHGSLSWANGVRYTDGRCGLKGNALIVPPVPEKIPAPELLEVWSLAASILHRSDRLLVFGFAFNPYDEAILKLLRDSGRKVTKVILVDIAPNTKAAQAIWPDAEIVGFRPVNSSDLSWQKLADAD